MTFWIVITILALAVTGLMSIALLRRRGPVDDTADYDLRVYRDQLKEVDRDLARGVIGAEDADRIRAEVARRLLAADKAAQDAEGDDDTGARPGMAGRVAVAVMALGLIGGSVMLYANVGAPGYGDLALADRVAAAADARANRPDQAQAEASLPPAVPQVFNEEYTALMAQLRSTVAQRPDDIEGHRLLARNEAAMGNFTAAHRAQSRVLNLLGESAAVEDLSNYADMLILAAGGYVSPQAEAVLAAVLARDPGHGPARYYSGLMMAQTGRPDLAFRTWDALLNDSAPDAPWVAPIRAQIEEMSIRAGVQYTLPPWEETAPAPAQDAPGPTADDVAAAQDMSPQERMEMIEGMVAGLSDRLATEGGPPADWARLIGALSVLGDETQAIAVYNNALEVFAADEDALTVIRDGARRASLIP